MIMLTRFAKLRHFRGCFYTIRPISLIHYRKISSSYIRCDKEQERTILPTLTSRNTHKIEKTDRVFQLRDYQKKCIDACLDALGNNKRRIGVSLPTGSGKTVIFSHLIDHVKPRKGYGNKVLILAHRKELITQAAIKCKEVHPEKRVDIEMANYNATEGADIIIASVQTLMRDRLEKFDPSDFKMVVVDEAHHAAADSYVKVFEHFGITKADSDIALVGFSATLKRDDMKSLSDVMDEIVFHMETQEMIVNKYLSDAKVTTVRMCGADLSRVSTRAGDFVTSALSDTVNQDENNELVLRTYLHMVAAHGIKSTLVFGVDVAHVKAMTALFIERGVKANFVSATTKPDPRNTIVSQFKKGELSVLVNCGIFTEGTDIPNIDCVLLVRPTKSENLLTQMIGRGLRLHSSKEYCHIVDFVGINNSSLVSVPSLQGLPTDDEINGLTYAEMTERKLELERKRLRQAESDAIEERLRIAEDLQDAEDSLSEGLKKGVSIFGIDKEAFNFQEIQLKTYESLSDFLDLANDEKESDEFYIKYSVYSWVKINPNLWIVNYPGIKADINIHLRLQRHTRGLTKDFISDVTFSEVYQNKHIVKQNDTANTETVYTLSAFRLNPQYGNHGYKGHNWTWKYNKRLVAPITTDIRKLLTHVNTMFSQNPKAILANKFQKWRLEDSTFKQQKLLFFKLSCKMQGLDTRTKRALINEIPLMTKGQVSDCLMAESHFPSHIVRLKTELLSKAEKRDELNPNRKLTAADMFFKQLKKESEESADCILASTASDLLISEDTELLEPGLKLIHDI